MYLTTDTGKLSWSILPMYDGMEVSDVIYNNNKNFDVHAHTLAPICYRQRETDVWKSEVHVGQNCTSFDEKSEYKAWTSTWYRMFIRAFGIICSSKHAILTYFWVPNVYRCQYTSKVWHQCIICKLIFCRLISVLIKTVGYGGKKLRKRWTHFKSFDYWVCPCPTLYTILHISHVNESQIAARY